MKLRETVRQQIKDYPQKIKSYLEQGSPIPEEKVRVVGKVMAAAARMEFLTGAIFVEGTEKKHKWETGNKSELIKHYSSAGDWCTRFATTIQDMITGRGTTASGYKLGGANPVYQPDVREAYGGTFVGTRSSEKQSGNPWNDLRKDLAKKKDAPREERKKIADAFFKKHFRPQAGDMMIVRRGSSAIHSFSSKKQSHTTMIERVQDYRLYTIEGNKKSRVTGRPFDLLNPDHVDEIVFIMRESILSIDPTVAYRSDEAKQKAISKKAAARRRQLAATRISRIALNAYMQAVGLPMRKVNESELLAPLQRINQLLQQYAVLQGYIEPIREGEADVVANMVRWELGPND